MKRLLLVLIVIIVVIANAYNIKDTKSNLNCIEYEIVQEEPLELQPWMVDNVIWE